MPDRKDGVAVVTVGSRVRLVALSGVAAPAMHAQMGRVGVVEQVTTQDGVVKVKVRFAGSDGDESFWLRPAEYVVVSQPDQPVVQHLVPSAEPTQHEPKESKVAEFATAVQHRIEQLTQQDAALAEQVAELTTQRAGLGKERRALEAAVAAYNRVRSAVNGQAALSASASVGDSGRRRVSPVARGSRPSTEEIVARWASEHDGVVAIAACAAWAFERGWYGSAGSARNRVGSSVRVEQTERFEALEPGVYRLRDQAAS